MSGTLGSAMSSARHGAESRAPDPEMVLVANEGPPVPQLLLPCLDPHPTSSLSAHTPSASFTAFHGSHAEAAANEVDND